MNQQDFLGHTNYNGNTTSMRDFQKVQQDFWTSMFLAVIAQGSGIQYAQVGADEALKKFNERFLPPNIKPDNLNC